MDINMSNEQRQRLIGLAQKDLRSPCIQQCLQLLRLHFHPQPWQIQNAIVHQENPIYIY